MRRGWTVFCCLAALGASVALAAQGTEDPETGPSLEYRPPKPILPEPKGPTPAAPVTVFREYFGSYGIGRGSFDKPRDVAFGANKRTYVLDSGNSRVQLFDESNNFLLEWGSSGTDESRCQFKNPTAIYVVPEVRIPCSNPEFPPSRNLCEVVLVLDTGTSGHTNIQWFKVPITRDSREKLPNLPCGHEGSVFFRYKSPRDSEGDFGDWGEYGISDTVKFNRPLDIVFEGAFQAEGLNALRRGSLFLRVLDAGNERIQRFRLTFDCQNGICFPDSNIYSDTISNLTGERGDLRNLVSLAYSREGSFEYLYLLGTGCAIQKFKLGNLPELASTWPAVAPESGLCVPARVRYDWEREYVYVLDSGNSLLSTFHRSGNFIAAMRGADRKFDEPGGFVLRPETGEFAVADTANDLVQKFTLR